MASPSQSSGPIKASCHCGKVIVTVPGKPEQPINECQCTICRRYAAAWAYYDVSQVTIDKKDESTTDKYIWGDRLLEFTWCKTCGCVMYWYPISGEGEMGVNSRMMEPDAMKEVNRIVDFETLRA